MCSRFYLDEWTEREVCRVVRAGGGPLLAARDVRPSEAALVLLGSGESQKNQGNQKYQGKQEYRENQRYQENQTIQKKLAAEKMRWGFLKQQEKGLFINARAENVLERPTFCDSVRYRRCVIPAAGFYEWDRQKEIASFSRPDSHILYMAGIYKRFEDENRFVILTTDANDSVSPVHDRMPLILEESELAKWTAADREFEDMLCMRQVGLCRKQEYEQQRMEFV